MSEKHRHFMNHNICTCGVLHNRRDHLYCQSHIRISIWELTTVDCGILAIIYMYQKPLSAETSDVFSPCLLLESFSSVTRAKYVTMRLYNNTIQCPYTRMGMKCMSLLHVCKMSVWKVHMRVLCGRMC